MNVQRGITPNLIQRCQFLARESTKIANSIGLSLVACGIPPLIGLNLDVVLFIRTHCEHCVRKNLINLCCTVLCCTVALCCAMLCLRL